MTHGVINLFGPLVSLLVGFPISKNVYLSDNGIQDQIYRSNFIVSFFTSIVSLIHLLGLLFSRKCLIVFDESVTDGRTDGQ